MDQELGPKISLLEKYPADEEGFLNFGDIARGELGMQCQYASRYVSGLDRPKLSDGLRIEGNPNNYHELRIHRDDAMEFIRRVQEHRRKNNI